MTRFHLAALIVAMAVCAAPVHAQDQDQDQQTVPAGDPQYAQPTQQQEAAPPPQQNVGAPDAITAPSRGGGSAGAGVIFAPADVPKKRGGSRSNSSALQNGSGGIGSINAPAGGGATKACPQGPSYNEPDAKAPKFDFAKTEVLNSPADVASWTADAAITKLDINADGFSVEFTKQDGPGRWTDITTPGWDGALQYTLWMVESIGGRWYASGPIEYWYGLERSGGSPSKVYDNWFYAADRWGPMACHQPRVGETVGFLVTHGDARNNGNGSHPSKERSNVVFVKYPGAEGGSYSF
jgi:hypothetical protein